MNLLKSWPLHLPPALLDLYREMVAGTSRIQT